MSEYITIKDLVSITSGTSLSERRLQHRVKTLSLEYDFIKKVSNVWRIHRDYIYHVMDLVIPRQRGIKRMKYDIKLCKLDLDQVKTETYLKKLRTINNLILKNTFDHFVSFSYKKYYSVEQISNEIKNIIERCSSKGFDIDVIYGP